MGPKNRNLPQPRTVTTDGQAPRNQEQSNKELIEQECERALLPLRHNNYAKALRLIGETCLRHPNSALAHRMQAHAHMQASFQMAAGPAKQRHVQDAVNSALQAVTLSPNSIVTFSFYVTVLQDSATDARCHEEVVRECELALAIEDPIDPADDDHVHENIKNLPTAEERIEIFRVILRSVIQKSMTALTENIEYFSEEEPSSQDGSKEEPSSQNLYKEEEETTVQVKKMEELSKETEARLAALNPDNSRIKERKKLAFLKNIVSSAKKITQSKAYWESITEEQRRGFLELKIGDLRDHFRSLKDKSAARAFSEAVDYAGKNKTWKFWPCYLCDEKFAKVESRLKHIQKFHKKAIARDLRDYVPREIDPDWAKLLVHGTWKPVDIPRAMEIIRKELKPELGSEDQVSREVPKKEDEVVDISKLKTISLPKACSDNHNWPLSDDIERAKLLESICGEFQLLARRNYLSMKNLSKLIRYTFDELQKFVPASGLRIYGLDRTPLCICFLGVPQLELVLRFLKHLSLVGDENKVPDTGCSSIDAVGDLKVVEHGERIVFWDEQFLRVEFMPSRYHDTASTCTVCDGEFDVLPDGDDLMHWLFDVPKTIGEKMEMWTMLQNTILSVLQENTLVKAVDTTQFKIEAASDYVDEEYACIRTAILRQNEKLTSEVAFLQLDKHHEILKRAGLRLWKTGVTYKQTTSLDYQSIMLPLLSLFMQAKMETLVDEDARQKADAAGIALLSELELDARKNTRKGDDPASHGDELNVVQEKKEEEPSLPAGPIVDFLSSENDVSVSADELKLMKDEERKLEEMLEHQRQIEYEAKQKILAKQMKNEAKSIPEIDVEMSVDFSGFPVSTKSPKDLSSASASRKNRSRSRSHGDVNQDKLPAQKNLPLTMSQSVPSETPLEKEEEEDLRVLSSEVTLGKIRGSDTLGPGMKKRSWVLNGLSVASASTKRQAVSPCPLRIALSELNSDSITFREGQMNDSSEVLEVILDHLHRSFSPGSGVFKTTCAKTPFDELFKLVRKFHETFTCDPNAKRCNGYGIPCHLLSTRPHVFTLVLGWETASECIEHILATLEVLGTEIDLGVMFDGLDPGQIHSLVSMVCYSGMYYICFVYSHELQKWNVYNDEIVKVIGSWDDVISECEKGHLQPTVLFFESVP
ncbi:hypothetical protein Acr_27g0008950 [Actinidia rufa]|uniref:C2H2-type domain-containing protein n=1 Tax=Actinidia rufa TaxID=165716 RepID=A0A7J0H7V2_9ERIC|nr:hypothetical protein Acr_27g0008950 [Actinidia rufa]